VEPKSYSPIDDIPEAQRDAQSTPSRSSPPLRGLRRWVGWFFVGLASAISGLVVSWFTYQGSDQVAFTPIQSLSGASATSAPVVGESAATENTRTLLGHRAHEEAPPEELVPLAYDRAVQLRPAAAQQLEAMIADAERQSIYLVPLSGFRSIADQQYLFFNVKAERAQDTSTRAEVSAPPGYSEHHTGYAIDIGDANFPDANLQVTFENTSAFQWLEDNAARYSFELSFPPDNDQGIQYEPWHWRFVGDSHSLETFYQAR